MSASSSLPNVHVSTHPCVKAKLSQLRSNNANARETKALVHEIALMVGSEALASCLTTIETGTVSLAHRPPILSPPQNSPTPSPSTLVLIVALPFHSDPWPINPALTPNPFHISRLKHPWDTPTKRQPPLQPSHSSPSSAPASAC